MKLNRNTSLILFALIVVIGIVLGIKNNVGNTAEVITPEPAAVSENIDTLDAQVIVTDSHQLDTDNSTLIWTAKKKIIPNYIDVGTFNVTEGLVDFDEDGVLTRGSIVIDIQSLNVTETGVGGGFNGLARDMLSGRFLDAEEHPAASFVITSIEKAKRDSFDVIGNLTIKDITKEVITTLDVVHSEDGTALITTEFEIDRTDYDITFGSDSFFDNLGDKVIDDIVLIQVSLQASRL
jgi:polyisoprenoid-binding protein YceI